LMYVVSFYPNNEAQSVPDWRWISASPHHSVLAMKYKM